MDDMARADTLISVECARIQTYIHYYLLVGLVAEHAAQDLTGRAPRDLVDSDDTATEFLVVRHALSGPASHIALKRSALVTIRLGRHKVARHTVSARELGSLLLVLYTNDSHVEDTWMRQ